jgi:hypothetical protein
VTTLSASKILMAAYLAELRRAARQLPRGRRAELVDQIEEHLRDAVPSDASEAATRTTLEKLGQPDELVAAERERLGLDPFSGGRFEWIAVALLLVGGIVVPIVGWLIGALMLWSSHIWTTRDKLIGTFLLPGGLGAALYLATIVGNTGGHSCGSFAPGSAAHVVTQCGGGVSAATLALRVILGVILVITPILTAVYLSRRMRRPWKESVS